MSSAPSSPQEYDAHHRDLAAQGWGSLGGLIQRAGWAPISHRPNNARTADEQQAQDAAYRGPLMVTAKRKRHPIIRDHDGTFRALTIDDVKSALNTPLIETIENGLTDMPKEATYQPLLLLQRDDVSAVRSVLQPAGPRYARAFTLAARQRPSARITVLTDLLSAIFWAPEDVNPTRISEWMDGMGLPDNSRGYQAAFDHALSVTKASPYTGYAGSGEATAIGSSFAGGVKSRNTTYYSLTGIAGRTAARQALDPISHRRAVLAGTANLITGLDAGGWYPITSPFRLREGKRVVAHLHSTDPAKPSEGPVRLVVAETRVAADGEVFIRFGDVGKAARDIARFAAIAHNDPDLSLVVAEAPFASAPPRNRGSGRWLSPTDPTPEGRAVTREVPAHIVIAGHTG